MIRLVLGLSRGCESESEVGLMQKKVSLPASKIVGFACPWLMERLTVCVTQGCNVLYLCSINYIDKHHITLSSDSYDLSIFFNFCYIFQLVSLWCSWLIIVYTWYLQLWPSFVLICICVAFGITQGIGQCTIAEQKPIPVAWVQVFVGMSTGMVNNTHKLLVQFIWEVQVQIM